MLKGFDFNITDMGELVVDQLTHDIKTVTNNNLKIQLAYDRIKSISRNWFIDEVGADLEEIIGRACNQENVEYGKQKIIDVLTFDQLFDEEDIFIFSKINNNINVEYTVYLKIFENDDIVPISTEIIVTLDLIKGVNIRYGWEPRR